MKQFIVSCLRKARLVSSVEKARYLFSRASTYNGNRQFEKANPAFKMPPLWLVYDAISTCDWHRYFNSGNSLAKLFADLILKHSRQRSADIAILEWGCGPGRIIRHLPGLLSEATIFGTDYNSKSIAWASSAIDNVQFKTNQLTPPLPYADEKFDVVYCCSVFTHLSEEMHHAWFEELMRVIKPNGLVIFTTHGDHFKGKLLKGELEEYETGRLVVRGRVKEGSRMFTAFHNPRFIRQRLVGKHKVLEHIDKPPTAEISQDIWIVSKTEG